MSCSSQRAPGLPVAMERLEDRLLLSTGPVVIGDGEGADARSLVYQDTDGTRVTVQLTKGNGIVFWIDPNVEWSVNKGVATLDGLAATAEMEGIRLVGTGAGSSLTFKTAKPGGRDNPFPDADLRAVIGAIVGDAPTGGIGRIVASGIDLAGVDSGGGQLWGIMLEGGAKQVTLGDVMAPMQLAFGGAEADKLSFTAGHVAGASLMFEGNLTQLKVASWVGGGEITVGELGKVISSAGTFDPAVTATRGSIGGVTVTAGDLGGSLAAPNGMIGDLKATAKILYEDMGGGFKQAMILGGNIQATITAGQVRGKSLGNVTATGGVLSGTIHVAQDVGNLLSKCLSYKEYFEDLHGRIRSETFSTIAGIHLDLTSDTGKVGNVTSDGGDLGGAIRTPAGVGQVKVTAGDCMAAFEVSEGMIAGITVVADVFTFPGMPGAMVQGGSLMSQITAGQSRGKSLGNVSVTGGMIAATVQVDGDVGNIVNKWLSYKEYYEDWDGRIRSMTAYTLAGVNLMLTSTAGKLGNVSVTGGDFGGEVHADAGIGMVSVTAGHFNAMLTALNGMVGGIKVTSQVQFNPQAGQPEPVVLGGDVNGGIVAGQVRGKSVGPISASGGAVGAAGEMAIQAAGSVGKISSTALSKGFWMTNEMGERTLMMAQRVGGVMLNLLSEGGKLEGISIVGGVLGGTIQADAGIGPISVKQGDVVVNLLEAANGPVAGITVTGQAVTPLGAPDGEVMVVGGNLSATVRSGQARGNAVGNITVTGGMVGQLVIEAVGNVGNITNQGLKYSTREPDEYGRMRSVPQYQMCGLSCTVTSEQGNVGKIAVTGGDVMATVRALNGTAAGIAGTGVMMSEMGMGSMCLGGSVFTDVEAASIGTVNSLGGFVTGALNAVKISGVSAKVITVGAKVQRWTEWGETWYETTPGMYFGGGIMGLMIQCVGANASVGAISSVGGPVYVSGEVATPLGRIKVTSKPVRYLADYQENENGRLVAVYETIGGPDMVSNSLTNPPGFP